MSFILTTKEAAKVLNISHSRVLQLIELGQIDAEKVSGIWLINSKSVEKRQKDKVKAGRPASVAINLSKIKTYTLMNRNYEILTFKYDIDKKKFFDAENIKDSSRAPFGIISARGKNVSSAALEYWWKHRTIPSTREGIEKKLTEFEVSNTAELPFHSYGLSLSDQYWIKDKGSDIRWQDINYFDNEFEEFKMKNSWLSGVGLNTPDNTSEGELPKKWICTDKGKRMLLKGGSALNQEPYNEFIATKLYERLLSKGEFVSYQMKNLQGVGVSASETFVSSEEEYMPAYYIQQMFKKANHHNDYAHYIECCYRLGVSNAELALAKMIVCDDILANYDRHWRNFGLIRNVQTCEYRIAPLFDTGNSLWCNIPLSQLKNSDFNFKTKPFNEDSKRQLQLVSDFTWLNIEKLDGFPKLAEGILSKNKEMEKRSSLIAKGLQWRIDRLRRILE
ncbi:MAG: DNA-binding protein [Anaerovoracaceae bacterium]